MNKINCEINLKEKEVKLLMEILTDKSESSTNFKEIWGLIEKLQKAQEDTKYWEWWEKEGFFKRKTGHGVLYRTDKKQRGGK